jgi:hypothetical protein
MPNKLLLWQDATITVTGLTIIYLKDCRKNLELDINKLTSLILEIFVVFIFRQLPISNIRWASNLSK